MEVTKELGLQSDSMSTIPLMMHSLPNMRHMNNTDGAIYGSPLFLGGEDFHQQPASRFPAIPHVQSSPIPGGPNTYNHNTNNSSNYHQQQQQQQQPYQQYPHYAPGLVSSMSSPTNTAMMAQQRPHTQPLNAHQLADRYSQPLHQLDQNIHSHYPQQQLFPGNDDYANNNHNNNYQSRNNNYNNNNDIRDRNRPFSGGDPYRSQRDDHYSGENRHQDGRNRAYSSGGEYGSDPSHNNYNNNNYNNNRSDPYARDYDDYHRRNNNNNNNNYRDDPRQQQYPNLYDSPYNRGSPGTNVNVPPLNIPGSNGRTDPRQSQSQSQQQHPTPYASSVSGGPIHASSPYPYETPDPHNVINGHGNGPFAEGLAEEGDDEDEVGLLGATRKRFINENSNPEIALVPFPFNIVVSEISAVEMKSVHKLSKNYPLVKLRCDNFYSVTKPVAQPEDLVVWEQVDWVIPVRTAENELQVLVESKNVLIGSVFISPEDVRELPMNPNQTRELVCIIRDGATTTGKLRFVLTIEPFAEEQFKPTGTLATPERMSFREFSQTLGSSSQSGSIAGGSSLLNSLKGGPLPLIDSKNNTPTNRLNHSLSADGLAAVLEDEGSQASGHLGTNGNRKVPPSPAMNRSMQRSGSRLGTSSGLSVNSSATAWVEDTTSEAIRFQITELHAFELPSAHTFKPNSPFVNLACGKFVVKTEIREKGGASSQWEDLSFTFAFEKTAVLRILVASEGKSVGAVNVSRAKILNGRKDEFGCLTTLLDLEKGHGQKAGKLRVVAKVINE